MIDPVANTGQAVPLLSQLLEVLNPAQGASDGADVWLNELVFGLLVLLALAAVVATVLARRRYSRASATGDGLSLSEVAESLRGGDDRFAEAMPGALLSLGLLFTFIGVALAIGEAGKTVSGLGFAPGTDSKESIRRVQEATSHLTATLQVLGFKFKASVWGLTLSLMLRPFVASLPRERQRLADRVYSRSLQRKEKAHATATQKFVDEVTGEIKALHADHGKSSEASNRMLSGMLVLHQKEVEQGGLALRKFDEILGVGKETAVHAKQAAEALSQMREVANRLTGAADHLEAATKEGAKSIGDAARTLSAAVTNDLKPTLSKAAASMEAGQKALEVAGQGLATAIKDSLTDLTRELKDTLNGISTKIESATNGINEAVRDSMKGVEVAQASSTKLVADGIESLKTEVTGFSSTIEKKLNELRGAIDDLRTQTDTLKAYLPRIEGAISASTETHATTQAKFESILGSVNGFIETLARELRKFGGSLEPLTDSGRATASTLKEVAATAELLNQQAARLESVLEGAATATLQAMADDLRASTAALQQMAAAEGELTPPVGTT